MSNENQSLEVYRNLLFPKIFQTFRMAIQPNRLIVALAALAVICLAGWIMDFSKTVVVVNNRQGTLTELQVYIDNPAQLNSFIERYAEQGQRNGVYSTLWHFASARFNGAVNSLFAFNLPAVVGNIADYFKAIRWALTYHPIYCLILLVIKLAAISIAAGAICRMAALQFARGEKPGLAESVRFAMKKFVSLFTVPLVPVGIVIFIGLFIFILGVIGNIPTVGELIVGLGIALALVAGALITAVVIGTVAGFNLMFPAIAYDGSDSFDAISRSFSYVYARPWRMGFYTAIAAVYGAICYTFVRFFAFVLLWVTHSFLRFGVWVDNSEGVNKLTAVWPEPSFVNLLGSSDLAASNWSESVAAFLIYIFLLVIVGLVVSFVISFYFSANTIIYSLMRRSVDDTDLEDVYTYPEVTQADQAAAGTERNRGRFINFHRIGQRQRSCC